MAEDTYSVPDALIVIEPRRGLSRRHRWRVLTAWATEYASGEARTFGEAKQAAFLAARLGPERPVPKRPDPVEWSPYAVEVRPYRRPSGKPAQYDGRDGG